MHSHLHLFRYFLPSTSPRTAVNYLNLITCFSPCTAASFVFASSSFYFHRVFFHATTARPPILSSTATLLSDKFNYIPINVLTVWLFQIFIASGCPGFSIFFHPPFFQYRIFSIWFFRTVRLQHSLLAKIRWRIPNFTFSYSTNNIRYYNRVPIFL